MAPAPQLTHVAEVTAIQGADAQATAPSGAGVSPST